VDNVVSKFATALTHQLAAAAVGGHKSNKSQCVDQTPVNLKQPSSKTLNPGGFDSKQFDQLQCMADQRVNLFVSDQLHLTVQVFVGKLVQGINLANHTSWLHMSNSQQLDQCLSRYLQCKNTAPAMTSAFVVKPSRLQLGIHAAVFKHMRLLREYGQAL
jgi:hypothetical protein